MKKYLVLVVTTLLLLSSFLAGCSNAKDERKDKAINDKSENASNNSGDQFLFTANEGGSISKISVKNLKVMATFKMDGLVHNIQVSPDGKVVGATIVPNMAMHGDDHSTMDMKGKAIFFNPKTNKLIKEVEVGNHPAHIVFTADGKYVLVTNNEDDAVSVIDRSNYSIIKSIPTGKGPHGFRISTDSQFAYVSNMGENSVSVLNLKTLKEEKKIQAGKTPVTTGLTSDGKTLVVTLNKENALAIIDLSTGKMNKVKVGIGPAQVYIQADNHFAYVANQGTEKSPSHSLTKVDLKSKQVAATIETGLGSHGVVTSPDNKFTYVTNMFDNTVSVIDNSVNKVVKTIKVGKTPNGISIMPK
ncbi:YncE family protein [Neobacillus sp. PS3-40]|uniref:YncE family protein n=1 Tax=Neobacillus sp. PS3-40 TaxID=3070679 RepID=UPI0027E106BB|nr:YncE family protein [Neobacillus sp. PS3-40]WML43202.1 YncE family protein [Neobacillus sp. PS3-40]